MRRLEEKIHLIRACLDADVGLPMPGDAEALDLFDEVVEQLRELREFYDAYQEVENGVDAHDLHTQSVIRLTEANRRVLEHNYEEALRRTLQRDHEEAAEHIARLTCDLSELQDAVAHSIDRMNIALTRSTDPASHGPIGLHFSPGGSR